MLFNEKVLELALSQMGLNIGWQSMSQQSMRVLQTLVIKYIQELGKATMGYANNCNRHTAFLGDVILAMRQMSISIEEVEEYINEVDCVPFIKGNNIPLYPCAPPKGYVRINFPGPEEIASRPEYMEEWLPSLNFGDKADDKDANNGNSDENNGQEGHADGENGIDGKNDPNDPESAAAHERLNNHIHLSSVYLDEEGRIVGRNGKEGVAPDSRLPPKDDYEERRIAEEEERRRKILEAEEAEKKRKQKIEEIKLKPIKTIKTKLKDKPFSRMKKTDLGGLKKKRGPLGLKGNIRKKSALTFKVSLSGLQSGTPTAKPSPTVTPRSPLSFLNDDDDFDSSHINSKENSKTTIDEDTSANIDNTINEVIERSRLQDLEPGEIPEDDFLFNNLDVKNSKVKKPRKKIIRKTKKKDSFDLTIDNVVKTSTENDAVPHEEKSKKDNVYTFSDEVNNDVKTKEESGVDAKEAAKILVSLSEDVPKKQKKSDLKKLKVTSPTPSSPPIFSGFKGSSTSFPKVAPGSTPLSPNSNATMFGNPFSSPLRSPPQPPIPTPPLFSSRSDFYQLGSSLTSTFQPYSNSDQPPKPALKTLAAKKALPPIDEALLLKKEKKERKMKEKAINKKKDKDKEREKKKEKEREKEREKEQREKEKEKEREREREKEREREREREREKEREKEREREIREKEKEKEKEKELAREREREKAKEKEQREKEKLKAKEKSKNLDEIKESKKSKKLKKNIVEESWLDFDKVDTKLSIKAFNRREESPVRDAVSPASSTSSHRLVIRTPPSPSEKKESKKKKQRTNSSNANDEPPTKKAKTTLLKEKVKEKGKGKEDKKSKDKLKDDVSCVLITETITREERGRQEEKEWLCPVCSIPYDGAGNMIGCDGCDDWYHWTCVGIKEDPGEEESWFCVRCIQKQKVIETKVIKKPSSKSSRKDWSCPICRANNPNEPMVGCDKCDEWYHYCCVNLKTEPAEDETWYCPPCLPKAAPITTPTTSSTLKGGAGSSSGGEGGRSSGTSSKNKKSKQSKAGRPPKSEKIDKKDSHKSSSSSSSTAWSCRVCNKSNSGNCIACDSCDQWFHWPCVGIVIPPKSEDSWYCEDCIKTQ